MSFKYAFNEYPTSGVNKLLATNGGKHIYNVTLDTDAWNGALIARGEWNGFDNYKETSATSFKGIVQGQAANGNYYVEVDEPGDALLVYNPPVVEAEFNKGAASEKHFYLAAGEVARAHELAKGDIFELSVDGFSGATAGESLVGKSVDGVTGKKPVLA